MKIWLQVPIITGVTGWIVANAWAGPGPPSDLADALRAIEQAPDPSAAVAAYANAVAIDRNNPKLYDAYVSRMVDLGLPELAYRQAQTLTTLESTNGLAWGVVGYVDARRGDMPEAISALNVAGQTAPDNSFVQRTAGEIVAWYDTKADKTKLPENVKDGLTKARALLEKQPAFTEAYDTAKNAYQSQNSTPESQAQPAPNQYGYAPEADQVAPLGYAGTPAPAPVYNPDYYYDWGPTWVQPASWWWWQPVGFFAGFNFVPFSTFVVFDNHAFFFHHHFFHHDGKDFKSFPHGHGHFFNKNGMSVAFHDPAHAFFHQNGKTTFFGAVARPTASAALSARANLQKMSGLASGTPMMTTPSRLSGPASSGTATRPGVFNTSRSVPMFMPSMPMRSQMIPPGGFRPLSPQFRSGMPGTAPFMPAFRGGFASPGFRSRAFAAPRMALRPSMPMARSFVGAGFRGGMARGGFQGWHR